jgi:uncharacterized protein (DUF1800 family)
MPAHPIAVRRLFPVLSVVAVATISCARASARETAAPMVAEATASGEVAQRELTADEQVMQALNRLTFGARPGDPQRVRDIGVDRWIERQLRPESSRDTAVAPFLAQLTTLSVRGSDLEERYPPPAQLLQRAQRERGPLTRRDSLELRRAAREANRPVAELLAAKVGRAVVSDRQLEEVMVDFWENHFNIYVAKGPRERYFLGDFDRDVIRPRALGKFRDLLGAVAKSEAMLFYLDNWESVADSAHPTLLTMRRGSSRRTRPFTPGAAAVTPAATQANRRRPTGINENYARELLELHTLGVDGGYTQQDVIEVARALTGWSIKPARQGGGFLFRAAVHDAGAKLVLGHRLAAGRGIEDGEDVLDIVAHHPSTAHFIAFKLARRFVSDTPPAALVDRAAETFRRTDGDIREVVRTIVTSPEFFSRAAWHAKVKSPFEVVVSALRSMDAEPDTTPRTALLIGRMGEPLFGHQAPDGYPETGDAWMNTGAILNRINFGLAMAAARVPGVRLDRWPPAATLAHAPRAAQVDGVVATILGGAVSPDTRAVLLSGQHPLLEPGRLPPDSGAMVDSAASAGVDAAGDDMLPPGGEGMAERAARRAGQRGGIGPRGNRGGPAFGPLPPLEGLAQVIGLALGSPEFQRH